ncbi:hypothetical protein AQUSIP_05760 [Aquicella siphonis]|uniref:Uncharacterized protein n=2 Tax=Aquicella siphonis TaxID=254247 RepID=A0A5E4PFL5_9COXI|nr:hypothetical protein AQUSIP_05760 [Aquicella siphonis]
MSDQPLTDCPECHQPALNKLVSAAGFQLKGSGWYVTDYSAKGKSKSAQESAASTGGSTETKPENSAGKEPASSSSSTGSGSTGSGEAS